MKRNSLIIIICMSVVFLSVAGGGIYYVYFYDKDNINPANIKAKEEKIVEKNNVF